MGTLLASSALIAQQFGSTASRAPRLQGITTSAGSLIGRIYYATRAPVKLEPGYTGPFRPPQWSREVPLTVTTTDPQSGKQSVYVFDGALRAEHEQHLVQTLNPVQTGAAISDHAYVLPARLTIEIAMSDAMQSYDVSQWNNGPSRSVSAFQTLKALQKNRQVVAVSTRLQDYDRMLVASVRAIQNKETAHALKALVTFAELLTATIETISAANNSALPQTTTQTTVGQTQTKSVPGNVTAQNLMSGASSNLVNSATRIVPGAGAWSSVMSGISSRVVQ